MMMVRTFKIMVWVLIFTLMFAVFAPLSVAGPALAELLGR
jgi:hypothetical protein